MKTYPVTFKGKTVRITVPEDEYQDCVRCEWQLIETGEPGVCDTCGWNRLTGSGPEWTGKKGSD